MPRRSAADIATLPIVHPPPEPPAELSPEEAETWLSVTRNRQLGDELQPLLFAFCAHARLSRQLRRQISEVGLADLRRVAPLLRAHRDETAAMTRLATKLRLFPTRREATRSAPWEL
jgi:hypothetical protein